MTIEASHYGETRRALMADPHIRQMAEEIQATGGVNDEVCHKDGSARYWFMMACVDTYRLRAGEATLDFHLGGPAEAVLALLQETGETSD
jgi:hypothetical protein